MKRSVIALLGFASLLAVSCGTPKAATETETEKIVTYAITFDTGKATLKPEADQEILRIRDLMKKYPELKYEVQGHCDNTGSNATNDKLSQQRAEAIVARLVELGISYDRLTPVGKGSREPIADNKTEEGRAKNRRVEFVRQ
ncbi:MAG: OmpA family protein [Bacteroidales bacterium]|nr:OmpA family protein [Bacteroidales bacterium]